MGENTDDFTSIVLNVLQQHDPSITDTALKSRTSKDRNYLSITVTFNAQSQTQLDALYQQLNALKEVKMML